MSAPAAGGISSARDILAALRSGTTPSGGLDQLAIGLDKTMDAVKEDLAYIERGGSGYRMILGEYGSGKSFLCGLLRDYALSTGMVASVFSVSADSPIGDMAALYRSVAEGLRTHERRSGCALQDIVERWLYSLYQKAAEIEGVSAHSKAYRAQLAPRVEHQVENQLEDIGRADVGAARVVLAYFRARLKGDTALARDAVHWLRGSTRVPMDTRRKLGIKGELDRESAFGMLKALLRLVKLAGFPGTLVCMDEAETILRLPLASQRSAAYETLRMLVDACGEQELPSTFLVVTGTDTLLHDKQAGIASYAALLERIKRPVGEHAPDSHRSPLLELRGLDAGQLGALARRIRALHAAVYSYDAGARLPDSVLERLAHQVTTAFEVQNLRSPRAFVREVVYLCDLCQEHATYDPESYVLGSASTDAA